MEDNMMQNNALAFWAGLVLFFVGLIGMIFYLFVRTATESAILPGPTFRLKHFLIALLLAAAGAVIASFARPRTTTISETSRFNR